MNKAVIAATRFRLGARPGDLKAIDRDPIQRPIKGESSCDIGQYLAELHKHQEREAQQVANLTGWAIEDIRKKIPFPEFAEPQSEPWWKRIWG